MKRNEKGIEGRAIVLLLANKIRTTRRLPATSPPAQARQPTLTLACPIQSYFLPIDRARVGHWHRLDTTGRGDGESPSTLNPVESKSNESILPALPGPCHARPSMPPHGHVLALPLPPPLPWQPSISLRLYCCCFFPSILSSFPSFASQIRSIDHTFRLLRPAFVCRPTLREGRSFPVLVRLSGFLVSEWLVLKSASLG